MNQIVIGTAGHIDHGKTALVKALTGVDTDHLQEEKSRGMTIDLGFAFLNKDITIIDVPGHEKFIRNMVSGVSTIHIALVVVAADDGVMPQTKEHLQILSLLCIPQGVIVLTKTDMVSDPDWLDLVEMEIHEIVAGTSLESAPIIRTSINPESGISELRQALLHEAGKVRFTLDRGFFRLPIDRVFLKTGFGIVVTGTVISGSLSVGDEIYCQPIGQKCKVRGLQSHGEKTETVSMGDRAAVNVVGIEKNQAWRGAELVQSGWIASTSIFIAHVQMIPGIGWELKSKQRVRIHLGTAEVLGRVTISGKRLKTGESGIMLIRLEKPLVAAMDDRFVMRSYSPMHTIGGGVILDPNPKGKWNEIRNWMNTLSTVRSQRFNQFIDRFWTQPKTEIEWGRVFHCSIEDIQQFITENRLEIRNKLVYNPEKFSFAKKVFLERIKQFHKQHPYRKSINGDIIRKELRFSESWFTMVVNDCVNENLIVPIEAGYALKDHEISLSSSDQKKADLISEVLAQSKFAPQSLNDILEKTHLEDESILELLHVLKGKEKSIEIKAGLWLEKSNFNKLISMLKSYFLSKEKLSVPDFKTLTHLTRKTAIPLLEYLDKIGFTFREENERIKGDRL